MTLEQNKKLKDIDRSEPIDLVYVMRDGTLTETSANRECPNWDDGLLLKMEDRFLSELTNGGFAIGAFDGELLVGFDVLANEWRGKSPMMFIC